MAEMRKNPPQEQKERGQVPVHRNERSELSAKAPGGLAREGWQRSWPASPFGLMRQMFDDMDRLFGGFGFGSGFPTPGFLDRKASGLWSPQVEVFERDDHLIVRADLPGLTNDDVQLDLRDDALVIRGQRREQHEESREGYAYSERSYGSFSRQIALPSGISPEDVDASFENGVLEVKMKLPEQSRARRRKIEIRSGSSAGTSGTASTPGGSSTAAKAAPQEQPVK